MMLFSNNDDRIILDAKFRIVNNLEKIVKIFKYA